VLKKQWPAFLLAFVLPLLGVYAWWGGFSSARVEEAQSGPYFYAYLDHAGDLAKLPKTQERVFALLKHAGIEPGDTLTVLYTDPRITPRAGQRARTGYLVRIDASLPAELKSDIVARRHVLSARVRAAALLAPGKAYQALHDHLEDQGLDITLPAVEIYRPSGSPTRVGELTVEIPSP
jgi:hypothetical protein